jgi:hypothetical protein
MEKIQVSVMRDLISRLLSDGALRRADSSQAPEKKPVEWISSVYLARTLETRTRKY